MALSLRDRVVESTQSTGTGTILLSGAEQGYQRFATVLSDGDTTYYTIQGKQADGSLNDQWEVGIGTYNANTLSRDVVLDSSSGGVKVDFVNGNKDVFIDLPSEKAVYRDTNNVTNALGGMQLDTAATTAIGLGKFRWNPDTATAAFGIVDGTDEVNIGEQMFAYVTNAESVAITRGQAVYLYQAQGNRATVKLASNLGDATSAKTLGLVAQDSIGANQTGFVITQGQLSKVNTSAFAEGTTLYLGATAGSLTSTKPKAPNHLVYIGVVERSNAGNGQIYVRPQNGYELDEIHDVLITSPTTGQTIVYDSATSLWKNSNAVVVNGGTIDNTPIGATTPSTGKFTSVTTPSVTATTNDLTLSAISTGVVNFNTANGTQFRVADGGVTSLAYWTAFGAAGTPSLRAIGSVSGAIDTNGAVPIQFRTNIGTSGAEQFRVAHTASAVNHVQVTGGATGNRPSITAQGSDANSGLSVFAKGTGGVFIGSNLGTTAAIISTPTTGANYFAITGSAANFEPRISVDGSDTNINLALQSKGTGSIDLASGSTGVNVSNGTTVTAITTLARGSGFTALPVVVISAPNIAGGVQATATAALNLNTATLVSGGTGYTVNDVLTFSGVTGGTVTVRVDTVSAGVITAFTVTNFGAGSITAIPSNPVSVTGGTGTGATFNANWNCGNITVTNAGSGYTSQPTVTITGGTGATAYASVGSAVILRSIAGGSVGSTSLSIYAPSGESMRFTEAGGASVNYWRVQGASTGNSPQLIAQGSDTNVGALYTTKGTSGHAFYTNNFASQSFAVTHTASAVNYVQVTGSVTGGSPVISVQGSDTNAELRYRTKGIFNHHFENGTGGINFTIDQTAGTSVVNRLQVAGALTTREPVLSAQGSDTDISMVLQPKGTGTLDVTSAVNLSNGNTVTAITRTVTGSGYTSIPTITISAPNIAGGVQATAFANMFGFTVTIVSGGTGYTVGDALTAVGGTGAPLRLTVSTVSAGVITAVTIADNGYYSALPTNPISVTGGTGTGATFNIPTYGVSGVSVSNAGSGYTSQPTVTFSGGGGSGASAYATVGSAPTIRSLSGSSSSTQSLSIASPSGEVLRINDAGTTVANFVGIRSAGANSSPFIRAQGSDTNVNFAISSQGTGVLQFFTNTVSQEQFRVSHTASAVNYVQVTGASTGSLPTISAQGSDTNIGFQYNTKGFAGSHRFQLGGSEAFRIEQFGASGVANRFSMFANVAGSPPMLVATGSDTNVGFDLSTKGTGIYRFSTNTANAGTGAQQFAIAHTASAVNYVQVTGSATGSGVGISVQGSDTNIAWDARTKGSGAFEFSTGGTYAPQFQISHTASAVNRLRVTGSATGASPVMSAQGNDTNINITLTPKGTGRVQFGTHTATADTAISGYIEILDAGGTVRRLAVIS